MLEKWTKERWTCRWLKILTSNTTSLMSMTFQSASTMRKLNAEVLLKQLRDSTGWSTIRNARSIFMTLLELQEPQVLPSCTLVFTWSTKSGRVKEISSWWSSNSTIIAPQTCTSSTRPSNTIGVSETQSSRKSKIKRIEKSKKDWGSKLNDRGLSKRE